MMATGMLYGFLSGAGNSVAQSAQQYQTLQDTQALDAARSDLQIQAAQRIAENNIALQNSQEAQQAAIYNAGMQNYTPTADDMKDPDTLAANQHIAGLQALVNAGKGSAVTNFNAAQAAENAQEVANRSGIMPIGYGGQLVDVSNIDPTTGKPAMLVDNSIGRTEVGMANAGARQTSADAAATRANAIAAHYQQMPDANLKLEKDALTAQAISLNKGLSDVSNALMSTGDPTQRAALTARAATLRAEIDDVSMQQQKLTETIVARASGLPAGSKPAPIMANPSAPHPAGKAAVSFVPGTTYTDANGNKAVFTGDPKNPWAPVGAPPAASSGAPSYLSIPK